MDESDSVIITVQEVADLLRIPLSSVYRLAQDGRIPAQKVGKHWRFHKQTILNWVASGQVSASDKKTDLGKLDFS